MSHSKDKSKEFQNQFWIQRWQDGDIGWHHQEINLHLLAYWHKLGVEQCARVFVPMCGKSRDMIWLAQQGHSIVGVEISEIAVEGFFSDQDLIPERKSAEHFQLFNAEKYQLLCGDIFQLKPYHLQGVTAVYDRASLVALDTGYRQSYAKLLAGLLPANCSLLLVAMDYPQHEMQGPPYSVPEGEIYSLFDDYFLITQLHSLDLLKESDRYRGRGLSSLSENIYMLQRK